MFLLPPFYDLGHSLESDLLQLKLIHNTVVDTSVVFPHKLGLPYKRGEHFAPIYVYLSSWVFLSQFPICDNCSASALRTLMLDHLQKIIQQEESGHDSAEDARSCLELMQWKVKADLK